LTPAFYCAHWNLVPDGTEIATPSSLLLPVRRLGVPAMLKIARDEEERRGGRLMGWWQGDGAARVLLHDDTALLLERAEGSATLAAMVAEGRDDEASRVLCSVGRRLHAARGEPPVWLEPLARWFAALAPAAVSHGGVLAEAHATASKLLSTPREIVVLHGDIHHGNVLDGGMRGWLAIDPKALRGERTFDFVNILRNPDTSTALAPGRFERQLAIIARAAALEPRRLIEWMLAFAGLSASWHLADGTSPALDLEIARLAAGLLRS
jgi:streptomycin 6-kinase